MLHFTRKKTINADSIDTMLIHRATIRHVNPFLLQNRLWCRRMRCVVRTAHDNGKVLRRAYSLITEQKSFVLKSILSLSVTNIRRLYARLASVFPSY